MLAYNSRILSVHYPSYFFFNLSNIAFSGAQASFVTHRLVKTYYLSGSVIPFAGQRVVPSHLPAEAILANYLSKVEGSMDGLVQNLSRAGRHLLRAGHYRVLRMRLFVLWDTVTCAC